MADIDEIVRELAAALLENVLPEEVAEALSEVDPEQRTALTRDVYTGLETLAAAIRIGWTV